MFEFEVWCGEEEVDVIIVRGWITGTGPVNCQHRSVLILKECIE